MSLPERYISFARIILFFPTGGAAAPPAPPPRTLMHECTSLVHPPLFSTDVRERTDWIQFLKCLSHRLVRLVRFSFTLGFISFSCFKKIYATIQHFYSSRIEIYKSVDICRTWSRVVAYWSCLHSCLASKPQQNKLGPDVRPSRCNVQGMFMAIRFEVL